MSSPSIAPRKAALAGAIQEKRFLVTINEVGAT